MKFLRFTSFKISSAFSKSFTNIVSIFTLLGYLYKDFLGKMNKIGLNTVMIVILIYFLYKAVVGDQNSIIDALIDEKKYIFCTIFHISYIMGAFHSDKVKKILDRIKFKRKK